jgi:hypothetical protein
MSRVRNWEGFALTDVLMMQTADADVYRPMLEVTAEVNRTYCNQRGYRYESYFGIKRGRAPWMATYNRIFMLQEALMRGFEGWVIFADADAIIVDFDFDLLAYLEANSQYCLIGATGGSDAPWNLNAGILMINLGDPEGRSFVLDWRVRFDSKIPDDFLEDPNSKWDEKPNDQDLMYDCIRDVPGLMPKTKREEGRVFNYSDGSFMKQAIRAAHPTLEARTSWLRQQAARVLDRSSRDATTAAASPETFVDLTWLANHYGTDKGDEIGNSHNYTSYYQFLFDSLRLKEFDFLEIGLLRGGPEVGALAGRAVGDLPSVRMWLEYFPRATCHGADISDFSEFKLDRFVFHQIDIGVPDDLARLRRSLPMLRFVMDDGSHASFHQQLCFSFLFPLVEPGGMYIIEDMDWQPEAYERDLPKCNLTRDVFWSFCATGDLPITIIPPTERAVLASQIARVHIHRRRGDGTAKLLVVEKR